jgi:hypothetical protein
MTSMHINIKNYDELSLFHLIDINNCLLLSQYTAVAINKKGAQEEKPMDFC